MSEELIALLKRQLEVAEIRAVNAKKTADMLLAQAEESLSEATMYARMAAELKAFIPPDNPLREEYDSMAPHQRAHFGSFEAYCAMHAQLEAPIEESGSLLPEYVWLTRDQISDAQERGAISRDNGRYAIRVEDLTPEQKAVKP